MINIIKGDSIKNLLLFLCQQVYYSHILFFTNIQFYLEKQLLHY